MSEFDSKTPFLAYYVQRHPDAGEVHGSLQTLSTDRLPAGDVIIQVEWSSLNYKDALAATGNPGVAKTLPHVPGIDAAGRIVQSTDSHFHVGQAVIVTGYELGAERWGGWSERIRVPAEWVVPLPDELTLRETMILGTAGFTAAQCVRDILKFVQPIDGPVAVSGATGGVGCLAVMLLAKLGFEVVASTGKANAAPWLMQLGASAVVDRWALSDDGRKPLLSTRWAAAVDTVGGTTLVNLLKSTRVNGPVTSCGLVAGNQLEMTVFPFILRGVKLLGITSALCPMPDRVQIWKNLAGPWRLDGLEEICQEISLDQVAEQIQKILAGGVQGRTLIRIAR